MRSISKVFLQIGFIVRNEARYLGQLPNVLLSAAILTVVPAIYCLLYISSVWQPESKTASLPVGIVNLDKGVQYMEHSLNVGWEITTRLEDSGRFGFTLYKDEQEVRRLVRQGKLAFAVIIPAEFSANAVPGAESGAGSLIVYTSQGNNYQTAAIAKHFAETLEHDVNESLNERRWVLVLHHAAGSKRHIESLQAALKELGEQAASLQSESEKTTLAAIALANATRELTHELVPRGATIESGKQNYVGPTPSRAGLQDVASKAKNISDLTDRDHKNSDRLKTQIDLVSAVVPKIPEAAGTNAEGLSHSVSSVVEIDAPVENSGSGFASNVVPGALWLGAAMAAFLIHIKVMPRHALHFHSAAQVAGKMFLPACAVLVQSILVFIAVRYVLKIHLVNPWTFFFTLAISSLSFLSLVFALGKAFGEMGKQIAIALLAVQLSSSGGLLPVELSGGIFAEIGPWLPLTWVVNSVKVAMFGAFGGGSQMLLFQIILVGVISFTFCCIVGKWRFVKSLRPKSKYAAPQRLVS